MIEISELITTYSTRFGPLHIPPFSLRPAEMRELARSLVNALKDNRPLTESELAAIRISLAPSLPEMIQPGQRLPEATFQAIGNGESYETSVSDVFNGRIVILAGLPGVYDPTRQRQHLAGYRRNLELFFAEGADAVACTAAADACALQQLAKTHDPNCRLLLLADHRAAFAASIGAAVPAAPFRFTRQSRRYAMIVRNGLVKALGVEPDPAMIGASGAIAMLQAFREFMYTQPRLS